MKKRGKLGLILDLCVVAFIIIIVVVILLPAISPTPGPRRRPHCKSNLKQIGLAILIYVNDHDVFPSTFEPLVPDYIDMPSLHMKERSPFQCPVEGNPATTLDYRLVALGEPDTIANPSSTVLAYDRKGNHPGGRNLVFADGYVEWVREEEFQELMDKEK